MEERETNGNLDGNEERQCVVATELLIIEGVDEYLSFEKFFQTKDCS